MLSSLIYLKREKINSQQNVKTFSGFLGTLSQQTSLIVDPKENKELLLFHHIAVLQEIMTMQIDQKVKL